jgi:hypothetical protein
MMIKDQAWIYKLLLVFTKHQGRYKDFFPFYVYALILSFVGWLLVLCWFKTCKHDLKLLCDGFMDLIWIGYEPLFWQLMFRSKMVIAWLVVGYSYGVIRRCFKHEFRDIAPLPCRIFFKMFMQFVQKCSNLVKCLNWSWSWRSCLVVCLRERIVSFRFTV